MTPTLYEAVPFPNAPRYFARRYQGDFPGEEEFLIWGYSCRSTYPEDAAVEDRAWKEHEAFPSVCFSEREREGEYGFTPLSAVVPVECWVLEAALADLGVEWVDSTKKVPGDEERLSAWIIAQLEPIRVKWTNKSWNLPEPLLSEARQHVVLDLERALKRMAEDPSSRFNEFAGRGYWDWKDDQDPVKLREFATKMAAYVVPQAFAPDPPVGEQDMGELNSVKIVTEPVKSFPSGTPVDEINEFLGKSKPRGAYGTNEGDVWLADDTEIGRRVMREKPGYHLVIEMMNKDGEVQESLYTTDNPVMIERAREGSRRMEGERQAKKKANRGRDRKVQGWLQGENGSPKISIEPGVNHHFNERMFGRRWEGLYGWTPVLKGLDLVESLYPAVDVQGLLSHSGDTEYPASDLLSAPELLTMQTMGMLNVARPIWVGPSQLLALPEWAQDETQDERGMSAEACEFARDLQLPFPVVFLDFTDASGEPAWLPYVFQGEHQDSAQACLYGALVARIDHSSSWHRRSPLFGMGSLVIVPFGTRMRLVEGEGGREVRPIHNIVDDMVYRLPDTASIGYVQFGPTEGERLFFGQNHLPEEPVYVIGDMSTPDHPNEVRPTLGLLHVMPILRDDGYGVIAGTGTAQLVKRTMEMLSTMPEPRLGVWPVPEDSKTMRGMVAESTVVTYQAECVLKALLLLESQNVELVDAPVSRQVRRAIQRSSDDRGIAQVVHIRTKRTVVKRPDDRNGEPAKRDYAYAFDRRGHYKHVTKGPHVKNPDHMKPCPIWQTRHPETMVCRREYVPPTVVGVAEGRPYVPKSRTVDATDEFEAL